MLNHSSIFTLRRSRVGIPKPIILKKASAFDNKQELRLPIGDTEIAEEEPEEILCTICFEHISDALESHYKVCQSAVSQQLPPEASLDQISEKIQKLRSYLSIFPDQQATFVQYCSKLLEHKNSCLLYTSPSPRDS